jgi:alkylated DNA repair dioxygenase AlkB
MFELLDTPLQTDDSFLKVYSFSDASLIESAVAETAEKLNRNSQRNVGFFSNDYVGDYFYGPKKITTAQPLTPATQRLLSITNEFFSADCNGIIVNEYVTGKNVIEVHRDSKNHADVGVIIISYGVTRNFRVFRKDKKKLIEVLSIPLKANEAIHMGGRFQEEFLHDIEPDSAIQETRYSFSFHKYMSLGLYNGL